jgi:16S rRNA (cytosine1402-N4)-methyltransferase
VSARIDENGSEGPSAVHRPVLLREVLEVLSPAPGETHVDGTVGLGGHAVEILKRLGSTGLLVGIDRDPEALGVARSRLEAVGSPFRVVQGEYSDLINLLRLLGVPSEGAVDGLLLDLGVSSLQLDRPDRGFSFSREGPLDMRMTPGHGESAADLLGRISRQELEEILRDYGEEPAARRIARAIEETRSAHALRTTSELARLVETVVPRRGKRTHPATRVFQAIRIVVNRELEHLRSFLRNMDRVVRPGGRVVVLSYHSLEDRMVKDCFREGVREGLFRWISPDAIRPGDDEIAENPRARSARLRAVARKGA